MGRWVNHLRVQLILRFCCCYGYPQCTTASESSFVSLCLFWGLLFESIFLNVCCTLSLSLPLHFARERIPLLPVAPHLAAHAVKMLVTLHWCAWWWKCSLFWICLDHSQALCDPVQPQLEAWAQDVFLCISRPRNRGGLSLFPSISFIGLHQCPKGTRFYCPAPRTFRRWGERPGWGFVLFLQWPLFPSFSMRELSQNHQPALSYLYLNTSWVIETNLHVEDLAGGSVVKNLSAQCRRHGFNSWSGKIPHAAEQLSPCATITEPVL